jgi:hypothetical protein
MAAPASNKFLVSIDYGTTLLSSKSKVVSANTPLLLDSFDSTLFRSAEYLLQIEQNLNYVVTKMLLIHNDADVAIAEYATVGTGSDIQYTFNTSFNAGDLELTVTCPTAATFPVNIKYSRVLFDR